jgi:hypothetical protein
MIRVLPVDELEVVEDVLSGSCGLRIPFGSVRIGSESVTGLDSSVGRLTTEGAAGTDGTTGADGATEGAEGDTEGAITGSEIGDKDGTSGASDSTGLLGSKIASDGIIEGKVGSVSSSGTVEVTAGGIDVMITGDSLGSIGNEDVDGTIGATVVSSDGSLVIGVKVGETLGLTEVTTLGGIEVLGMDSVSGGLVGTTVVSVEIGGTCVVMTTSGTEVDPGSVVKSMGELVVTGVTSVVLGTSGNVVTSNGVVVIVMVGVISVVVGASGRVVVSVVVKISVGVIDTVTLVVVSVVVSVVVISVVVVSVVVSVVVISEVVVASVVVSVVVVVNSVDVEDVGNTILDRQGKPPSVPYRNPFCSNGLTTGNSQTGML